MSQAIWMLRYRIKARDVDEYESWFHRVHIPEKLARPGYTWAVHYKASLDDGDGQYTAMFGGSSSRVFHNPSPAQLKLSQNEQTRRMMAMRREGSGIVFVEEWTEFAAQQPSQAPIQNPAVRIRCFDARGHDEDLSAWIVQELTPQLLQSSQAEATKPIAISKLLAVNGTIRHALIERYTSTAPSPARGDPSPWSERIDIAVAQPTTLELNRIWPSP